MRRSRGRGFRAQAAERAGVKIGDIILAVNGRKIDASQPGDQEVFDTMIRRLSIGGKAVLRIVRDRKPLEIKLALEAPPTTDENIKRLTDADFEFAARELTYSDHVDEQIPDNLQGVLLQKVEPGGWASLGGLRGEDFVISVNEKPTATIADLKAVLDEIRREKPCHVVFYVRRGIHTLFCEVEPDYR